MKKTGFILGAAVATMMTACSPSAPKAEINNEVDSISYAIGVIEAGQLRDRIIQDLEVDSTALSYFTEGFIKGAMQEENKAELLKAIGYQIGSQVKKYQIPNTNKRLFGEDSTQSVNLDQYVAGYVSYMLSQDVKIELKEAYQYANLTAEKLYKKTMEQKYGENKKAGEEFIAKIATKEGVQKLPGGSYYEVITEGKGAVPTKEDRVVVHYEGKLINDTVFDSSYARKDPTTFGVTAVIPGWTDALLHMPVGSKWKVYIPQDQAYGERSMGRIEPYSTLVFTVELLDIEKDK